MLWFWASALPSIKRLRLTWHQLVGVVSTVPLELARSEVAIAVAGRWNKERSRVDEQSLRGLLFPPGAAMDGAWRGRFDFAVFVGDCGREKDVDNSSPILGMLYSLGLRVNFFNFKDQLRVLGPKIAKNRLMYLCCCCRAWVCCCGHHSGGRIQSSGDQEAHDQVHGPNSDYVRDYDTLYWWFDLASCEFLK